MVAMLIEHIIRNKQDWDLGKDFQDEIGVVTPFKLQKKEIKRELRKINLPNINVGTVELFQAQEKKVIIISTVRTRIFSQGESKHIGFLSDPKRFNVAVTRAKSRLLIIGHPYALETEPTWRYLLKYCLDNKTYFGEYLSSSDDDVCSGSIETSEAMVKSSDVFKGKKFQLFALDRMDSKTDISETMRMILNSETNSIHPIQPITPAPSSRSTSFPKLDPVRPISYSVKLATPIKNASVPKVNPKLDPVRPIPYSVKLATPTKIAPIPKVKPKVDPVHPIPYSVILATPMKIAPVPKVKPISPMQPIQSKPPIALMQSPKINPVRPIPPVKATTPIPISPISEVIVQPIKPTSPMESTPIPDINPTRSTSPVKSIHPVIQDAPTAPEVKTVRTIEITPLPATIPSTPSPEIHSIRPTPSPRSALTAASLSIQLDSNREVQQNPSVKPKERKKEKCCVVQ